MINGALMVIGADTGIDSLKLAWVKNNFNKEWSQEELTQQLSKPGFRDCISDALKSSARVLRNKFPELRRARLLHAMCDVATCSGDLPDNEIEVLNHLRQLLEIRPEIAEDVLKASKRDHAEKAEKEVSSGGLQKPAQSQDLLASIIEQAKLPQAACQSAAKVCDEIRATINSEVKTGMNDEIASVTSVYD